jgi:acetyl-CoA acetyltransferase
MGEKAVRQALADARVEYPMIQQAYVGYVYGDSTCGQRALYPVGMSGIPIVNVNNNCSTGSSALFLARQAVESGAVDCVLALGFEQMAAGAIKAQFQDRPTPPWSDEVTRTGAKCPWPSWHSSPAPPSTRRLCCSGAVRNWPATRFPRKFGLSRLQRSRAAAPARSSAMRSSANG